MIKPIIAYGSPILRKMAQEIDSSYKDLPGLINTMIETMEASDGVGLAAPQIGLSIKLFVVDTTQMEDYPEGANFKKTFINPTILEETGEEWTFNEGCLSVPTIREDIARKSTIKIKYYDEDFNEKTEILSGICGRVVQHEYDHLLGKLFIDHVTTLKRRLLNGRLSNIEKGKVKVDYRIKFFKP